MKVPIDSLFADTGTLDFIAYQIFRAEQAAKGEHSLHWLSLRNDVQVLYLNKARTAYIQWAEKERSCQIGRQTLDPPST